ncbi:hypothetical protein [Amycolatopsis tolypomycina]|uniref:hypothetical protein n=1 Tax=Amycolatopsis tolypomycina TaxID=208445 RepID=UPI0033B3F442
MRQLTAVTVAWGTTLLVLVLMLVLWVPRRHGGRTALSAAVQVPPGPTRGTGRHQL